MFFKVKHYIYSVLFVSLRDLNKGFPIFLIFSLSLYSTLFKMKRLEHGFFSGVSLGCSAAVHAIFSVKPIRIILYCTISLLASLPKLIICTTSTLYDELCKLRLKVIAGQHLTLSYQLGGLWSFVWTGNSCMLCACLLLSAILCRMFLGMCEIVSNNHSIGVMVLGVCHTEDSIYTFSAIRNSHNSVTTNNVIHKVYKTEKPLTVLISRNYNRTASWSISFHR